MKCNNFDDPPKFSWVYDQIPCLTYTIHFSMIFLLLAVFIKEFVSVVDSEDFFSYFFMLDYIASSPKK